MVCLIILNGPNIKPEIFDKIKYDCVLCADGGGLTAQKNDIRIDVLLGDMDSIDTETFDKIKASGSRIIKYPGKKDSTDGMLVLYEAIKLGADEIIIVGADAGRLDHQYANLMLLLRALNLNVKAKIVFDDGYIFPANDDVSFSTEIGDTISILPFGENLIIRKTKGLKYIIKEDTIFSSDDPLGISNVAVDKDIYIGIKKGNALIFVLR